MRASETVAILQVHIEVRCAPKTRPRYRRDRVLEKVRKLVRRGEEARLWGRLAAAALSARGERVFGRKALEEQIAAMVRAEFAGIIADLKREHREYLHRLRLKEEARVALESAEAKVQELYSERIALKKRFWEAYYEKDEAGLFKIESWSERLERVARRAEKAVEKARANSERANFDEVAEGFALKAKANIAEEEVNRRIGALEKAVEALLAEVRHDVKETGQALRDEYKEPRFDTDEERDAYVEKTIEILKTLAESYTPGE